MKQYERESDRSFDLLTTEVHIEVITCDSEP